MKSAEKYLELRNQIYPEIKKDFEDIETNLSSINVNDLSIVRLLDKIKNTIRKIKQIDISEIEKITDSNTLETIKHNIKFIFEDLTYIQRYLISLQYSDDLTVPVKNYIRKLHLNQGEYRKWADNDEELTKKFIEMLLHPDNIEIFKNQIKRMALGTMSQKEFARIYEASKNKMIPKPKRMYFESFKEYEYVNPLNETYESYEELKQLAKNIYENYKKFILFRKLKKGVLYPIDKFVNKKFSVLNDFINNGKIGITYFGKEFASSPTVKGQYVISIDFKNLFIIDDETDEKMKEYYNGVLIIYDVNFSTILHELQHAYDDHRSRGNFLKNKKAEMFFKLDKPKQDISFSGSNVEDVTQQYKTYLKNRERYHTAYTRLPHEKSSFFIQTINKLNFFDEKDYLKDIHILWNEFKHKYQNFNVLTLKDKKNLARKFSQYYQKYKEQYTNY